MRIKSNLSSANTAALALVLVTVSWGSSFVVLKDVLATIPISDFLTLRFLLAGLVLWAVAPAAVGRLSAAERRRGVLLGLLYGSGQLLQGKGLETTPASISGFVTGMYVVLTPLLAALVLRQHVSRPAWMATAMATVGLGLLALNGAGLSTGVVITLISAVAFAAHILATGRWSSGTNFLGLTIVQLFTVAALSAVVAAPGGIVVPHSGPDWLALIYMAVVTGALALVVQTWAQSRLEPTRAAIVMTMEPVFAAAFAVLFAGDTLGSRSVLGAVLVLAAMYLVERAPGAGEVTSGEPVAARTPDRDRPHPAVTRVRRRRPARERDSEFARRLGRELAHELRD